MNKNIRKIGLMGRLATLITALSACSTATELKAYKTANGQEVRIYGPNEDSIFSIKVYDNVQKKQYKE